MKAVVVSEFGDSSVLKVTYDVAIPSPGPDQVLVQLKYSGTNFVDTYQRSGLYPSPLPFIAGREGAGAVTRLGSEDLTEKYGLNIGDHVAVFGQGTLAEYIAADAKGVLKLPKFMDLKLGAAVMLQGLTALTLVRDAYEVKRGDWVLVQAAAGGTGGLTAQMARHLGARVIGTTSGSESKVAQAKANGCEAIIDYKTENLVERVMQVTEGRGCEAVLSGVGKATFEQDMACVRRKGSMVTYGNTSGPVAPVKPLDLSKRNVKLVRPTLLNYITERDGFVARSTELIRLMETNEVKVIIGGVYTFDQAAKSHDDLTSGLTMGKLMVEI